MKLFKKYFVAAVSAILMVFIIGCGGPAQRSLMDSPLEKITSSPRDVVFDQITVVDTRTEQDKEPLKPELRYFVPALILFMWAHEGHVRPDSTLYSLNVPGEMQGLVKQALTGSGFSPDNPSPNAMHVNMDVEVTQLYGITHSSSSVVGGSGAASVVKKTFAPYGFSSAKITLKTTDGTVILRRHLTGIFSPKLAEFRGMDFNPGANIHNKLTMAAVYSAGDLASNIVRAIEPVLTNLVNPRTVSAEETRAFYISRSTDDGKFIEVVCLDKETGQILTSTINQRWMEPYVAVDEWVVDPYQGGDAKLTDAEYSSLVTHLQTMFDIRYATDVRTAHFFGKR